MAVLSSPRRQWRVVLRPRWLCWHAFAFLAFFGMLWLGDWQLHRALSGNELSWAYTFEWPLLALGGAYFWVRTIREELKLAASGSAGRGIGPTAPSTISAAEDDAGLLASHRGADESEAEYAARLIAEIRGPAERRGRR
jgi:hypothetical protein